LNKKSIPKCQDKWNNVYNEEFHWPKIWNNLDIKINVFNKSSCLPPILNSNIIFFAFKLTVSTFKVFIKIVMFDMNRLDITTVNLNAKNMMFEFNMGGKHELLLNTLIFISK
jgi:hypothetical protein